MAVITSFFDSYNYDRKYDAQDMMRAFEGFVREGIFPHVGTVFAAYVSRLHIDVASGKAYLNNRFVYNTGLFGLDFSGADPTYPRYDAIVLYVNNSSRTGNIITRTGMAASTPSKYVPPAPTPSYAEYVLYHILRNPGETTISTSRIENCIGTTQTPYVQALI